MASDQVLRFVNDVAEPLKWLLEGRGDGWFEFRLVVLQQGDRLVTRIPQLEEVGAPWECVICRTGNPDHHLCCSRCGWDHSNPSKGLPSTCAECGGRGGRHSDKCSGWNWDA